MLGLDASTSTIGIGIIEFDENYRSKDNPFDKSQLIYHEYYIPDKSNGIIHMLLTTREYIQKLLLKYQIDVCVIEDYARFMKGKSSAATIIPLAILNVTLRLLCFDMGILQDALNVRSIRSALKINKQTPKKEDIPDFLVHHLKLDEFPYYYKLNRKKEKIIRKESYDVADGVAVALSWVILRDRVVRNKKKKQRKKRL